MLTRIARNSGRRRFCPLAGATRSMLSRFMSTATIATSRYIRNTLPSGPNTTTPSGPCPVTARTANGVAAVNASTTQPTSDSTR